MQTSASFVIVILLQSLSLLFHVYGLHETTSRDILKHSSPFPSDFLFGTASSAYQVLIFLSILYILNQLFFIADFRNLNCLVVVI